MFSSDNIEGIEILRERIPEELQYWYQFGRIEELHYTHSLNDECSDFICCVEMILTDIHYRHSIKLFMYNVIGELSFDMLNGFWGGLDIEDLSGTGVEKHCRFRMYSFEQDIDFSVYCEKIKVELLN
ncbi:MAG: hypothetical protein IKW96_09725 [Ruminococcus sp.]|uniref:hypothetical protein n=1 Tax=Ruminococcus sp. TaxID=41978 RepID=UPI0025F4528F|nr:hypothetical protein [Ruminococcus sp.]MBR5683530.1 hypothetical protein [Ruminococcus sp.]